MERRIIITTSACALALLANACISTDSDVLDTTQGCDEFVPGQAIGDNVDVDPRVRRYMQAAADLTHAANVVSEEVAIACANIATDLGAQDTWSGEADLTTRISNDAGTGACDAAAREVDRVLVETGTVTGNFAISISRGECRCPFDAQAQCDTECAGDVVCDSGTPETRCEPGALSVICEGMCEASASCIGSVERPANCMGSCESTCVGECSGTCIAADGTRTTGDPNCMGKCTSSCNGTCRGRCRIDAPTGIACGASVRCTGGCTGTFTDPVCTTTYGPPNCMVDAECLSECTARVAAMAECDPTQVDILFDVASSPALQPLADTLEANLPALLDAAERQGELALDAAHRLSDSGQAIADNLEDLTGKSLACAGAATGSVFEAAETLNVSIEASVSLSVKVDEHAD